MSKAASRQHQIVIVGGGAGGIAVAARLRRMLRGADIAIVEPSDQHYYQPLWTLVGAGVVGKEASRREQGPLIPRGAHWIRDAVTRFEPDRNRVHTATGSEIGYEWLVVCPGIKLDWDGVKGLRNALGKDGVCSNYAYDQCEYTWETIRNFRGGTALFTMPVPPIKCAGAPQKIMYLAEHHFRRAGMRDKARIVYAAGTPTIFGVKPYAVTLDKVCERKNVERHFLHKLIELRSESREAVFAHTQSGEQKVIAYDMIHVTPPQGPLDVVQQSPLADAGGWVEVDKHTLQHPRFPNVFSLGDASSLPTSRTAAAVRSQAPVLAANMVAAIRKQPLGARYDGYAACPIPTDYGKLLLAEFDYEPKPVPSFPLDPTIERWSYYQFKRYVLPFFYWSLMLRGLA